MQCRKIIIKGNVAVSKAIQLFYCSESDLLDYISTKETDILQFTQNGFNVLLYAR